VVEWFAASKSAREVYSRYLISPSFDAKLETAWPQ
jgi:hypothetical protein